MILNRHRLHTTPLLHLSNGSGIHPPSSQLQGVIFDFTHIERFILIFAAGGNLFRILPAAGRVGINRNC